MDDLLNELNEEVIKTKPKNQLKDTTAELGKQLEERLNQLQRDARSCKKRKLVIADDRPKTVTREYTYSGSSFKPKSINTQRRVKVDSSRRKEMEESTVGMILI